MPGIKPYSKKYPQLLMYVYHPADQNIKIVCYQKLPTCIRIEVQFNQQVVATGKMEDVAFQADLNQKLESLKNNAANIINEILNTQISSIAFPAHELYASFLSLTSKKGGPLLLKKLEHGDGIAKVMSREVAAYRDARKLVDQGWLVKLEAQSLYYLLPEFRGLLSFGSIMNHLMPQNNQGRK